MRLIRIGVANVNSTVGAIEDNTSRCIELAHQMARDGVTLAAFPEQVLGGYGAEDLVQWPGFVASQRRGLERFARETAEHATIFSAGLTVGVGSELFNVAALVHRGRVLAFCPKEKLPAYSVFYETRTLSRGVAFDWIDADGVPLGDAIFAFDFGTIALEVCEDLWSPDGPMRRRCLSGAELVLNLSASPFRAGIVATRREMIATRAADNQATLVYVNLVGGNDGLVFDGGGFIHQNGRPVHEAPRFREGYSAAVVDLDRTTRCRREASTWRHDVETFRREGRRVRELRIEEPTADRAGLTYPAPPAGSSFFLPSGEISQTNSRDELLDDFFEALALGVADYYRKIGAFRGIGLALSGGRDSLLTLLIAWRAVQRLHPDLAGRALDARMREIVHTFYMPTHFSGSATRDAARRIAAELGATLTELPIEEAFERELDAARAMLGGEEPNAITKQNVQARVRGARMWNWANTSSALFLQTGNMSERAVGYTTVGGDLEGALSVVANLPKTVVIALLERLERRFGFEGIRMTLATVAGPELAESQSGEAELMPFEVLDACLFLYGAEKLAPDEVALALPSLFPNVAEEQLTAWAMKFARLFTQSIFKWVQAPLTLHVGALDLDRERALQLPVVQRSEWSGG